MTMKVNSVLAVVLLTTISLFASITASLIIDESIVFDSDEGLQETLHAVARRAESTSKSSTSVHNRGRLLGDACGNLVDTVLGGVGLGNSDSNSSKVECDCGFQFLPPEIFVECSTSNLVCVVPPSLVCGTPGLGAAISFKNLIGGGLPVTLSICYEDLEIGGVEIPEIPFFDFCFTLGESILSILTGGILSADRGAMEAAQNENAPDSCTAAFGDTECLSCNACVDGRGNLGTTFNCSNVREEFVTTECTNLGLLSPILVL